MSYILCCYCAPPLLLFIIQFLLCHHTNRLLWKLLPPLACLLLLIYSYIDHILGLHFCIYLVFAPIGVNGLIGCAIAWIVHAVKCCHRK